MKQKWQQLKKQWEEFQKNPKHQKKRIKDTAELFNVSEAELLSTTINESSYFLYINNWIDFFNLVTKLGTMMYLVRNDDVVHENITSINTINVTSGNILSLKSKQSTTLINLECIKYVFACQTITRGKKLYSFQIFDSNGIAIIKIYLKNKKIREYKKIREKYCVTYNYELQTIKYEHQYNVPKTIWNQAKYNQKIFKDIKLNPKNIADFYEHCFIKQIMNCDLMNKLTNNKSIATPLLKQQLKELVTNNNQLIIGVSNKGALQLYNGRIENVVHKFGWLNIMEQHFNLHIKDQNISSAFCLCQNNMFEFFNKKNHVLHLAINI